LACFLTLRLSPEPLIKAAVTTNVKKRNFDAAQSTTTVCACGTLPPLPTYHHRRRRSRRWKER
jgi:hypothetical protein